jgi:hypothetical protein
MVIADSLSILGIEILKIEEKEQEGLTFPSELENVSISIIISRCILTLFSKSAATYLIRFIANAALCSEENRNLCLSSILDYF